MAVIENKHDFKHNCAKKVAHGGQKDKCSGLKTTSIRLGDFTAERFTSRDVLNKNTQRREHVLFRTRRYYLDTIKFK